MDQQSNYYPVNVNPTLSAWEAARIARRWAVDFDKAQALYWWTAEHHSGQWSELYELHCHGRQTVSMISWTSSSAALASAPRPMRNPFRRGAKCRYSWRCGAPGRRISPDHSRVAA